MKLLKIVTSVNLSTHSFSKEIHLILVPEASAWAIKGFGIGCHFYSQKLMARHVLSDPPEEVISRRNIFLQHPQYWASLLEEIFF
jgi:hypothetical protein